MAFNTCLVLRNWSYWMLQPILELDQRMLISISELGDDLRAFLTTTWHCINFVHGRIRLIPYFDFDRIGELKVALIGNSSHSRTYWDTILSRFSGTHVLPMSAIAKCHAILERTKRWYNWSLFLGWQGILSILLIKSLTNSKTSNLWSTLFIEKLQIWPPY